MIYIAKTLFQMFKMKSFFYGLVITILALILSIQLLIQVTFYQVYKGKKALYKLVMQIIMVVQILTN